MRDAVAGALEDDGDAVEVDGSVSEEVPGDLAGSGLVDGDFRGVGWYEEDGEDACSADDGGPGF